MLNTLTLTPTHLKVPLRLASEFAMLSRHYRHHNVWHEVAVATLHIPYP